MACDKNTVYPVGPDIVPVSDIHDVAVWLCLQGGHFTWDVLSLLTHVSDGRLLTSKETKL